MERPLVCIGGPADGERHEKTEDGGGWTYYPFKAVDGQTQYLLRAVLIPGGGNHRFWMADTLTVSQALNRLLLSYAEHHLCDRVEK